VIQLNNHRHERRNVAQTGQIDVERVISEVRAGRPVALQDGPLRIIVLAVEALDEELAAEFEQSTEGSFHLVLTGPRLQRMGAHRREAGFIILSTLEVERIRSLAFGVKARLDARVVSLSPLYSGALELLSLSFVLPAAVVIPHDSAGPLLPGLMSASLDKVRSYRAARAKSLRIVSRAAVPLEGAPDTEFVVFRGGEGLRDHVAVIIGAPSLSRAVTVRLHSACLTGDLFGSLKCDCGDQLRSAAHYMAQNGGGVLLYIDQEGRGNGLSNKIRAYDLQAQGFDTYDADAVLGFDHDQRGFDFAANMLIKLGVARVRIMTNNPLKIAALKNAGLEVVSDQRILGRKTDHNVRYIASKRDRAGHFFEQGS
jgi:GTP cyclohydrolase II